MIIVKKRTRKGKQTIVALVDIEKAFDNVNWTVIFKMVKRMG